MFKQLSRTTRWFAGIIIVVLIVTIIMIAIAGNQRPQAPQAHYIRDNASADNKVEALKTMTADLIAVENNNKKLQQTITSLQAHNQAVIDQFKGSINAKVQQAVQQLQAQNAKQQAVFDTRLKQSAQASVQHYPINMNGEQQHAFIWVSDVSQSTQQRTLTTHKHSSALTFGNNSVGSLLHIDNDQPSTNHFQKKPHLQPRYTIPVNATLTGATLMTPLVGRVPIDGKLPSPYHFKLVLSANNLTANGYPMPGVKGAVMSGIASGDMLGSCARGSIESITFIFNDGTISTTQAKDDHAPLGYLSSTTGNPCIAGTFHSDAGIFLGAQMGLAGAEGYANALTSSQYMHSVTPEGRPISMLIGQANKAAVGQAGAAATQAAQTWWNRRVQNSFDYVYVPNVNPKTGRPMKVVVNIMQQIPINYDPTARKVSYEQALQNDSEQLD